MRLEDQLDHAAEDILRSRHALKDVLIAIRAAMKGQPGAASYDTPVVSGHTTVKDDLGVPMPAVSDPTGEAGCDRAVGLDSAVNDHKAIQRHAKAIASHADALVTVLARWQARSATDKERRQTDAANDPGCEIHTRIGVWRVPRVLSSTVNNTLERPYRLCEWCERVVKDLGRLPEYHELRDNVDGKKLRRTA